VIYTLHGWSFNRRVWRGTPFEDATHLELPGHGESPFKSTDLKELAGEIAREIAENSTLVGWSLGASVALLIAASYPEKVEKLILYAPTQKFSGLSQPEVVVQRFLKRARSSFEEALQYFRKLCSPKAPKAETSKIDKWRAISLLESFSSFQIEREQLQTLKCRVKILVGGEDRITTPAGALSIFKETPHSECLFLPGEDHFTILKHKI
jgi:pimeloyl-[acyl-carrier protein] methyl ester esterase